MKAIEQYFHVVLFTTLYKVVLAFKSVDESLVCNHLKKVIEQYFYLVLFIILFESVSPCGWNPSVWLFTIKRKLSSIAFMCNCFSSPLRSWGGVNLNVAFMEP